jgi:lysine biosynthesis protein LysW
MALPHRKEFKARCPECLAPVYLREEMYLWDPVTCPECHRALEVISLDPPELDYMNLEEDRDDAYEESE